MVEEDSDVSDERRRLIENPYTEDILRIENLSKVFFNPLGDHVLAVDKVSVGIKSGEVMNSRS